MLEHYENALLDSLHLILVSGTASVDRPAHRRMRGHAQDLWWSTGHLTEPRQPLPAWSRFLAQCGRLLASSQPRRLTIGLTVPTRGYAALLAAAGATLEREARDPMSPNDLELHLEVLRATPTHTPIEYHVKDTVHDGRWLGVVEVGQEEMLFFETRKMTRKIRLDRARDVRLTGEQSVVGQLRQRNIRVSPLLKGLLGDSAARTFETTARPDCIIVGTQTLLEAELTTESFYASSVIGRDDSGALQDLVRARDVVGAKRFYRSIIVPSAVSPGQETRSLKPPVVIFDGGRAYVRWRHLWPEARQLVVIDRSLSNAEEGADALSMAFAERSASSTDEPLAGWDVPPSIEAVGFERST